MATDDIWKIAFDYQLDRQNFIITKQVQDNT